MSAITQDLVAGFDPTGDDSITSSDLMQLVNAAQPADYIGFCVSTTDVASNPVVPDAATTTKFQKYLWRRVQISSIVIYTWNDSAASDATYLKWQSITLTQLADGSITNSKYAALSITDDKILSVGWAKITGIPAALPPNGAAGGDLTGTYPNPTVGANKIDGTKLLSDAAVNANRAVGTNHIKNQNVLVASKIDVGATLSILRTKADVSGAEWVTKLITQLAEPDNTVPLYSVRVKADGSGFEYFKGIVQTVFATTTAVDNTATAIPYDNTIPQITEGKEYLTITITPKSATSKLRIRFSAMLCNSGANRTSLALFQDTTANALQAVAVSNPNGGGAGNEPIMGVLDYVMTSGTTAATTFRVRFGPSSGTGYINQGTTIALFGSAANVTLSVDEYAV